MISSPRLNDKKRRKFHFEIQTTLLKKNHKTLVIPASSTSSHLLKYTFYTYCMYICGHLSVHSCIHTIPPFFLLHLFHLIMLHTLQSEHIRNISHSNWAPTTYIWLTNERKYSNPLLLLCPLSRRLFFL